MKENDRLIDAIIDLGKGMKELRDEVKTLRSDMNRQLGDLNKRVESLEKQQAQTNLVIRELRLSYMKLAEKFDGLRSDVNSLRLELCKTNNKLDKLDADFNKYAASNDIIIKYHEKRIKRLEDTIFSNEEKIPYMVKEPEVKYKKTKKK